jgi:hypothetical protein
VNNGKLDNSNDVYVYAVVIINTQRNYFSTLSSKTTAGRELAPMLDVRDSVRGQKEGRTVVSLFPEG